MKHNGAPIRKKETSTLIFAHEKRKDLDFWKARLISRDHQGTTPALSLCPPEDSQSFSLFAHQNYKKKPPSNFAGNKTTRGLRGEAVEFWNVSRFSLSVEQAVRGDRVCEQLQQSVRRRRRLLDARLHGSAAGRHRRGGRRVRSARVRHRQPTPEL